MSYCIIKDGIQQDILLLLLSLLPSAYAVEVMFLSCVCLSVCVSVRAITFEVVDTETSFLYAGSF